MAKALYQTITKTVATSWLSVLQVLVGSLFLSLMAQVAVPLPFTPVPVSLQTFAVALLAITLGSKKAPIAVMLYLVQATMGFPVLALGAVNPLWMVGPKAGYLLGFVASSFVVGKLVESNSKPSLGKSWLILSLNEAITLCLGALWLSAFVGWPNTLAMGVIPFIPGALLKISAASLAVNPIQSLKGR